MEEGMAIIVVSFGTTNKIASAASLELLIQEIQALCSPTTGSPAIVLEAYTSSVVRHRLLKEGTVKYSLEEAIEQAYSYGATKLAILPALLIYGREYAKLLDTVAAISTVKRYKAQFTKIECSTPLLASPRDIQKVLAIVVQNALPSANEALLLIGHGTSHYSNFIYAAIDYEAKALGYSKLFIGTIEAYPSAREVVPLILKAGCTKVLIAPLLLVKGKHFYDDIASPLASSYMVALTSLGIRTRVYAHSLGEIQAIRALYIDKLQASIDSL